MAEDSTLNLTNLNDHFLDRTINSSNNIRLKKLTIQEVYPFHFFFSLNMTLGYS